MSQEDNIRLKHPLLLSLTLVIMFLVVTPLVIALSLTAIVDINKDEGEVLSAEASELEAYHAENILYSSQVQTLPTIAGEAETGDARPEIVRQYLASYDSQLEPLAPFIVETADKYKIDFRLITAIAQQESNLCKRIPPDTFNCWGWGIHSRGTLGFNSYEEGIDTVSRGLKEEYLAKGYTSVPEIMSKYTPLSNGSWAEGVSTFMADME